jgi:hypothetical protein
MTTYQSTTKVRGQLLEGALTPVRLDGVDAAGLSQFANMLFEHTDCENDCGSGMELVDLRGCLKEVIEDLLSRALLQSLEVARFDISADAYEDAQQGV